MMTIDRARDLCRTTIKVNSANPGLKKMDHPDRTQERSRNAFSSITSHAAYDAGNRCTTTGGVLQIPPVCDVALRFRSIRLSAAVNNPDHPLDTNDTHRVRFRCNGVHSGRLGCAPPPVD